MPQQFRSFVIFAGMRTGSNLLEATLNKLKHVNCFGELFNPYMLGWPDEPEIKGITKEQRDADPLHLLRVIVEDANLTGFRYFFDHDPRVFDAIMDDPLCAKIVLTRNPVESYVSTQLAWQTNQWKLNQTERPLEQTITFDAQDFRETLEQNEAFVARVQRRLQVSGQAAYWLDYDDLRDTKVMTGLLHWLGRTDFETVEPASDQVPQNPREMAQKVANFPQMEAELARIDPFRLSRMPNFEPRRGPSIPTIIGAETGAGALFMPILGGPTARIEAWLAEASGRDLARDFTPKTLRQWKQDHPGHRSFTVVSDPLNRAWAALRMLVEGTRHDQLRRTLRDQHDVPIPEAAKLAALPADQQKALMAAFLEFLRRNLNGQTGIPTHRAWASQSEVLTGFARHLPPDLILRAETLERDLIWLCDAVGLEEPPELPAAEGIPAPLAGNKALREAARRAYARDYAMLGFAARKG